MFIRVKLLNGLPEPLWYSVPELYSQNSLAGLIVQVPLRNKIIPALVIDEYKKKPTTISFALKDIHAIQEFPHDNLYHSFLQKLGDYYCIESLYFIKRIHHFLIDRKEENFRSEEDKKYNGKSAILTDEQQKVCDFIVPHLGKRYMPTVLHGVTGSGKTEVYKHIFLHALSEGKTTLLLLPEVTLACAFETRLKEELPTIPLYGFHSGKTPKEKKEVWNNLINKVAMVIIGVHLPILLPLPNLGIIIIDEEHDKGYQEKKHPKINTKEAALMRAQEYNIPIILGSATPSMQTLYNVKKKQWKFFQLKQRFSGILPSLHVVSLAENKNRKQFWISKELEHAIKERLEKKEQTIIFINRRGLSFFVQCKQCAYIFCCTDCSVSLTLHENDRLVCHYCSMMMTLPSICTSCKEQKTEFLKKGIGTQKVVTILQKMFPKAIIARADHDTTIKKKIWQKTITNMHKGEIDILVGTQTITKGFHFPNVTLVGVLWADLQLSFPAYNAAEITLQQLIQVAGRAGREHKSGTVIIQTMADHELFRYLNEIDYLQFYASEIKARMELHYPPAFRLAEIELKHVNEKQLDIDAYILYDFLYAHAQNKSLSVAILGPSKPPISKIKSIHSRKIYLKASDFKCILQLYRQVDKKKYSSSIYFLPNSL